MQSPAIKKRDDYKIIGLCMVCRAWRHFKMVYSTNKDFPRSQVNDFGTTCTKKAQTGTKQIITADPNHIGEFAPTR